jgi:tetratricopeptide (TPR) repeat protein
LLLGRTHEAIAAGRKALGFKPDDAEANNYLARGLATCADPEVRDLVRAAALAKRAVELAQKQEAYWNMSAARVRLRSRDVELAQKQGAYWNTLGVAHYRAGNWKTAISDLEKSVELRTGGDSHDWFVLAMAHWRLGEKDKARQWYDRAVRWMDENQPNNEELRRFRAEAAELLEVN